MVEFLCEEVIRSLFDMDDIRYLGPNEEILGHEWPENVRWFDIASYIESLVPVTPTASLRDL